MKVWSHVGWLGVNYRIKWQDGKVSIVHHDNLKLSRIPSGNGQIVPPSPESGDLELIEPLFEANFTVLTERLI